MTTSTTFQHPWYEQLDELESTTTAESESTLNLHPEALGLTVTEDFDELIWAAGIFEGEGTLVYIKSRDSWHLKLEMCDKDIVERYARIFDLNLLGPYTREKHPNHKPSYIAKSGARDKVFEMVCDFYPYLGERRRDKCDEFLQWYAAKTGKRYD